MKKTLIAMGVLGAFSSLAFAASNVTLYGIIEEGVIVQKAKHGDNKVELNSGFGQGSRWGIKGVEDLGNGYSAGFVLEQGFNADNGNEATSGKPSAVNLSCMLRAASAPSVSAVQVLFPSLRLRLS